MPVLNANRPTKTISLPSYPDSKVEIYDSLLVGDLIGQDFKEQTFEQVLTWMPKLIKSWNFTDESGAGLPVSGDSLKMLKATDVQFLMDEITKFASELKKG